MQTTWFHVATIILTMLLALKLLSSKRRRLNLPPYPGRRPLPFIGHFHLLKHPFHRQLEEFAKIYGPVISLKFGNRLVVAVASPSAAEECLTKNDITLANRPNLLVGNLVGYDSTVVIALPYGDHWRNLRRLTSEDILSPSRLRQFQSIRQDEVKSLLHTLHGTSNGSFAKVHMKSKLTELTFNIVMRMIAEKRYFGDEKHSNEVERFRSLAREMLAQADAFNPEDFIPFLRWIDYRGLKKRLFKLGKNIDAYFQDLIEEHRKEKKNTMIAHLLNLQESDPVYYTDEVIKGLVLVVLTGGTETVAATTEWAMSLLLNHPHVLEKARAEIDIQIGENRLITEEDLPKLNYIQCIILEAMRLFPAGPLMTPHFASEDCTVQGYDIPRGTVVLFNVWAIHRSPEVWEDPLSFKPERFINKEVDPFVLMPFGRGRRACPGSGLAQRVVNLTLASLIQCFEWERVTADLVNLDEAKGLSMPKAEPLEALCKSRPFVSKVLHEFS